MSKSLDLPQVAIPPLYSVPEAAEKLGTSRQNVNARIERGSLPGVRVGDRFVLPAAVVDALAAARS